MGRGILAPASVYPHSNHELGWRVTSYPCFFYDPVLMGISSRNSPVNHSTEVPRPLKFFRYMLIACLIDLYKQDRIAFSAAFETPAIEL